MSSKISGTVKLQGRLLKPFWLTSALGLILALAAGTRAQAQTTQFQGSVRGTPAYGSFWMALSNGRVVHVMGARARFIANGQQVTIAALHPDTRVVVSGRMWGTQIVATEVDLQAIETAPKMQKPSAFGSYHPVTGRALAAPPSSQTTVTGIIQALRYGYIELSIPGRVPLWVHEFGARIMQNGRVIGPGLLRIGQGVQAQGRMAGVQFWASVISILPPGSAPAHPRRVPLARGLEPRAPKYAYKTITPRANVYAAPAIGVKPLGMPQKVGNHLIWGGQNLALKLESAPALQLHQRWVQAMKQHLTTVPHPYFRKPLPFRRARGSAPTIMRFNPTALQKVNLQDRPSTQPLVHKVILGNPKIRFFINPLDIFPDMNDAGASQKYHVQRKQNTHTAPSKQYTPILTTQKRNMIEQFWLLSPSNNSERADFVNLILDGPEAPGPWPAPPPLPPQSLNPNNYLLDINSTIAFAGQLNSQPICSINNTTSVSPFCGSVDLAVNSPTLQLVIPTRLVILTEANGSPQYSTSLPVTSIQVQELQLKNGQPVSDMNDPDGVDFVAYPGLQPISISPNTTAYDPSRPVWIGDLTALTALRASAAVQTPCQTQSQQSQAQGQSGWFRDCNVFPAIVYPNPSATNALPGDIVTITLPLTQIYCVIRLLINTGLASLPEFASLPIPITVMPSAAAQLNIQPLTILYQPQGDQSSASFTNSQTQSISDQSQYSLSQFQSQANNSSQSLKVTATATASSGIASASVTASAGWDQSTSTSNQQTTANADTNSISQTFMASSDTTAGPPPTSGPPAQIWQSNHPYNQLDLVQPNPPDGNAYVCISKGTSAQNPPAFNDSGSGVTQDGTVQWLFAGSASLFEQPFWNDQFVLQVHPQYEIWNFNGVSGGGAGQIINPLGGDQLPWTLSTYYLHWCAKGLYTPENSAANPQVNLSPYECAGLLALDPFYMYGQHVDPAHPPGNTNQIFGYSSGPSDIGQGSNNTITGTKTSATGQGSSTNSQFTDSVSNTEGNSQSIGITVGVKVAGSGVSAGVTAGQSQSQANGSGMTTSFQNTTKTNQQMSQQFTATMKADSSGYPIQSQVYVDTRFGTLMFRDAKPAISSLSPISPTSGSCGTIVYLTGVGFSGADAVSIGGANAPQFTVVNDNSIEVVVPPLPLNQSMDIKVSGENYNPIDFGSFTETSCKQ